MFSGRRVGGKPAKIGFTLAGATPAATPEQPAATLVAKTSSLAANALPDKASTDAVAATPENAGTAPRAAGKKFGFSLGGLSTSQPKVKQHVRAFAGDSSTRRKRQHSSDEETEEVDKVVLLTGFEGNQAMSVHQEPEKGPLVIKPIANRDWRADRRKLRQQQIEDISATRPAASGTVERISHDASYGLQLTQKRTPPVGQPTPETASEEPAPVLQAPTRVTTRETLEQQAIDELLADAQRQRDGPSTAEEDQSNKPKLVLPMQVDGADVDSSRTSGPSQADMSRMERDAFKVDLAACPDVSTLDDYDDVPIEEFGAALLRGMGWKDGQGIGRGHRNGDPKSYSIEQRPRLLGLGAKPKPPDEFDQPKRPRRPKLPLPPPLP
ncbi:DExH-box splicing factor binding site-domain-containing protein [Thamnocephalis sphaerospora]|uniref:DExH-box splicing factor binding site-domain-containing protein n=1 Tax=Thamnocephalis sphaerospora TaxID=78915 RepID=A0A4P9XWG8_9FUNG|nr:DExH-box splicing factor binding site-domain-containing protein [Thamnocephalis sphaerospora]|eukprot:RKP10667.1 DExH-box splicing factor binding site-domain-containing protein [Thamnocephalis sphaerospora]